MHRLIGFLAHKAYLMRRSVILMTTAAGSGHPTSALSAADIVATLFFGIMRFDPANSKNPNNDRFILSKGHAVPIVYAVWHELGRLTKEELLRYRQFTSVLEGHPTPRFWGNEAATGSLGQGLSIGVGMALEARLDARSFYTYVLLGDGEMAEGSVWEAVELAAFYKLRNLVAIIDVNRLGQSGPTMDTHFLEHYAAKFRAFGWEAFTIDGHDYAQIFKTCMLAKTVRAKPTVIIAKTYKGFGIPSVQNKEGFHGKPFKKEEMHAVLTELADSAGVAAQPTEIYPWQPTLPAPSSEEKKSTSTYRHFVPCVYEKGSLVATRKAFGEALLVEALAYPQLVVLDGDVKNSTFTEIFAAAFPERFIEAFIAEQNMMGMATGLSLRGKIAVVATFGAFLTRAFDQLRMAAIGGVPLRVVGSHAGVSIGQDGPSQMALEDIALMRTLPSSVVLYPCDAVSTKKLVALMIQYDQGVSYLRTTRSETPCIYSEDDVFEIGGFGMIKQSEHDTICVIAAGITIFEALKAYERLAAHNIFLRIIDLYCIKPLNEQQLKNALGGIETVITVEDHYLEGGMGQAVMYALRATSLTIRCLAVTQLPRSGTPEELRAFEKIDAETIIAAVKNV